MARFLGLCRKLAQDLPQLGINVVKLCACVAVMDREEAKAV